MFVCPNCKIEFDLPQCNACGYIAKNQNNIWQLSCEPDMVIDKLTDNYIGYEHIGEGYSGNKKYIIEERDYLIAREIAALTKDGTFLDIACGDGCFTVPCASFGTKIIAADISNSMLSILQQKAKLNNISLNNVTICRMNALDIPLQDNSVDTAVANSVLHLISNPEKVIGQIYRTLKNNGAFICLDDIPGKQEKSNFDNSKYNDIINMIYKEYWSTLNNIGIFAKKHSWKFDRNTFCDTLFKEKLIKTIKRGNRYTIPLKDGFLPRFTARGFSDQTCVPKDIHDKIMQDITQKLKTNFGSNFANTEFNATEDDIQITIYKK